MQFLCFFYIKCVRYSKFSNRVIALTQSVKIQIFKAIFIEYALFAQNSIAFSIANNFASMTSIYLSEFQCFAFVSALKNCTVAASVVFEFFASSIYKIIEFFVSKIDFNKSACFSIYIFIFNFLSNLFDKFSIERFSIRSIFKSNQ